MKRICTRMQVTSHNNHPVSQHSNRQFITCKSRRSANATQGYHSQCLSKYQLNFVGFDGRHFLHAINSDLHPPQTKPHGSENVTSNTWESDQYCTSSGCRTVVSTSCQQMRLIFFAILLTLPWRIGAAIPMSPIMLFNRTTASRFVAAINTLRSMARPTASKMNFVVSIINRIINPVSFFSMKNRLSATRNIRLIWLSSH